MFCLADVVAQARQICDRLLNCLLRTSHPVSVVSVIAGVELIWEQVVFLKLVARTTS